MGRTTTLPSLNLNTHKPTRCKNISFKKLSQTPHPLTMAKLRKRQRIKVFQFSDRYRGAGLKKYVCPFYCSYSGYENELLWGAAWLHKATRNSTFLNYIQVNGQTLGADDSDNKFGWNNKHVGARILLSKVNEAVVIGLLFFCYLVIGACVGLATVAGFIWWFVYSDSGPKLPYSELDHCNHAGIAHNSGMVPLLKLLDSRNGSLQHNAAFALYGLVDNEVL